MMASKRSLREALAALSEELKELLRSEGRAELADQIPALEIVALCGCGDEFCASFYTAPPPRRGDWFPGHETIAPDDSYLIVTVSDRRIVYVEVLFRHDIREALRKGARERRWPVAEY